MNFNNFFYLAVCLILFSCSSSSNSEAFIEKTTGRYLFNADEVLEVYFENEELYLKWRGAASIKPLKVDDLVFYVKEMNEKLQFQTHPSNGNQYICIVPKDKEQELTYDYRKLKSGEKIPSEYLKNNEFDKALLAYKAIQVNDSLNDAVDESQLNSLGYRYLREKEYQNAINIFKINVELYPKSSNVYDSYGQALLESGDTINSLVNYKLSLELDPSNNRARNIIEKHNKE